MTWKGRTLGAIKVLDAFRAVGARSFVDVELLATGVNASKVDVLVTAVGGDCSEVVWVGVAGSWHCGGKDCESRDDCSFGEHLGGGLSEDRLMQRKCEEYVIVLC